MSETDSDAVEEAKQTLEELAETLRSSDVGHADRLAEAVEQAGVLDAPEDPLTVTEWIELLEDMAGEVYAHASQRSTDPHSPHDLIRWYLRHDGEYWVYGTNGHGELYRGEQARRQIEAVLENHDVKPGPIEEYPLEEPEGWTCGACEFVNPTSVRPEECLECSHPMGDSLADVLEGDR